MLPYLWLDQDQIDKQHHEIVLDVFVAETPAVLAYCQPDIVPARLVAAALAPEGLDGVPTFYTNRHCGGRGISQRGRFARGGTRSAVLRTEAAWTVGGMMSS